MSDLSSVAPIGRTNKCKAHKKDGSRCGHYPIRGGTVCKYHGGAAPQVQMKAKERLEALVAPAIMVLGKLLHCDECPSVQLGAVRDVLDRNGFKPTDKVESKMTYGDLIEKENEVRR